MSYQDEAILRDKNGDPIPQYYDTKLKRFEPLIEKFSDDVEVSNFPGGFNVNNLPEDYPDADVKAELEYINAKIDGKTEVTNLHETQNVKDDLVLSKLNDLETKIQATNDKLDGTINTQLTGSIAEDGILTRANKDFAQVSIREVDIEANSDVIIDVYSNPGEIWTLKRFGYSTARDRDSTGSQSIWLYHGGDSLPFNFMLSISGTSKNFLQGAIPGRRIKYAGEINPSEVFEMVETIRDTTVLSDEFPIRIRYRNLSDKPLSYAGFKLFFLVEKVGNDNE